MTAFKSNLHTHTFYSDGVGSCEDYIKKAIESDFESIGFSDHGYAQYDLDCCIAKKDIPQYFAEIKALKDKYANKIEVYTGFESDYFAPISPKGLDFLIGSVHYVGSVAKGETYSVDENPQRLKYAIENAANGDVREFVKLYYHQIADMALTQTPDIIGHFDLILKLNGKNAFFDPSEAWYKEEALYAIDAIAKSGCIVEVNTGAMSRGYTKEPYPFKEMVFEMNKKNIPFTISSDAHSPNNLNAFFPEAIAHLKDAGVKKVAILRKGRFVEQDI